MAFYKDKSAAIILYCSTDDTMLMGWRLDGEGYTFPGGHQGKRDKDTKDTAVRKLKEELGIDLTMNELINKVTYRATTLVRYPKKNAESKTVDIMTRFNDVYICVVRNKNSVVVSSVGNGTLTHPKWMTIDDIIESEKIHPPALISINVVLPGLLERYRHKHLDNE